MKIKKKKKKKKTIEKKYLKLLKNKPCNYATEA